MRDGLLPAAQKAAASRGVYSDVHVEILREIRRLKLDGVPLGMKIRERVRPLVERRQANEPDLVALRAQQTRDAIVQAAALQFARNGYKRARIGDIIKAAGVTPPMFYARFATKRQVFIESFSVFVRWMSELIEPPLADEPDPAVRLIMRMYAYWGLQRLSPDLLGLARAEALQEDAETPHRRAGRAEPHHHRAEPRLRGAAPWSDSPHVSDELMAYGMFGAFEEIVMRASWDETYSWRDVMVAHLFAFLSVEAAYTGSSDAPERLETYLPLIERLVEAGPPVPRPQQPST